MKSSPTQKSLAWLRSHGWTAVVVEHWNAHARCTQDLFGFADILAIRPGRTLLVQTTTASHLANRTAKIDRVPVARAWLDESSAREIEVHGWKGSSVRVVHVKRDGENLRFVEYV